MKIILTLILNLTLGFAAYAQIATNFNCNDCSGTNHDLFTELAEGKVIVLCWVMPCGTCIGPAMTSYNIVQSYQSSYPGRVYFYMIDDFANTACPSLISWANSYNMPAASFMSVFSNASIDMLDYGSIGMPKVVVVGPGNQVFYNADDQIDSEEMMTAIDQALLSTGVESKDLNISGLNIYPNPAYSDVKVSFTTKTPAIFQVEITDIAGKMLQEFQYAATAGENILMVQNGQFNSGLYFIRIYNNEGQMNSSYSLIK